MFQAHVVMQLFDSCRIKRYFYIIDLAPISARPVSPHLAQAHFLHAVARLISAFQVAAGLAKDGWRYDPQRRWLRQR